MTIDDEMGEISREFLIESFENLDKLDRDFVELEAEPTNPDLLGSVFRALHTVKGTARFFGFHKLERLGHLGENLLDAMRGLGMLSARRSNARHTQPNIARATRWFRAPNDGVFRPLVKLGDRVSRGGVPGMVASPFSSDEIAVASSVEGIVIGINKLPLVNAG